MLIYAVDDEPLLLQGLCSAIKEALPDAEVKAFLRTTPALAELEATGDRPDAAFLDIEMPGIGGIELAKRIKRASPMTNIIFATGFEQYAREAFDLRASGYIMKPASKEKILAEMEDLRHPAAAVPAHRISIRCFGNFEVFADGKPAAFTRSKSKELFAYLVDRCGAGSTVAEIAAILWDDGQYSISRKNQIHNFFSELKKSLSALGLEDVLICSYNSYAIDRKLIDCDLYRCIGGDVAAINSYCGEYMAQHSWAELTAGMLTQKLL